MTPSERFAATLSYLLLPIGWLYVLLFGRRSALAVFHCKQSIVLVVFLLVVSAGWVGIGWLLSWIPFGVILSVALFSLVIAALIFAAVIWIVGILSALRGQMTVLPIVGEWARLIP